MSLKPFTIAVSGSQSIDDAAKVAEILDSEAIYYIANGFDVQFRLGDGRGGDYRALEWARSRNLRRTIMFADRKGWDFWVQAGRMAEQAGNLAEQAVLASDWDRDGAGAGPIRNHLMIAGGDRDADDRLLKPPMHKADLLIAIWDGSSDQTRNAMATARNNGVFIHQHGGNGVIAFRTPREGDGQAVDWRGTL